MPIQDVALICLNGHNQSSIKNTENNTRYCETCGAKNISKCMECSAIKRGEIHPLKALIEMVEYFELNAENAEN